MKNFPNIFLFFATPFICANMAFAELRSTAPESFRVPEGFKVELVYEVPIKEQGSWVAMAVDKDGTIVASDQYGGLYRLTLSADGKPADVKQIATPLGMIQGICPTKDGLYVNVNGRDVAEGSGVYRLQDLDNDGKFETSKRLIPMSGTSEHGPHAIIQGADGRLYACSGNDSEIPTGIDRSRVPKLWGNDHLLGRMPDARGFMADRMGPGGFVVSFNPDGSDVELIVVGFRNEYDIAFNNQGELFTYDADMEWDVGTPWYRPTRVNHVVSGVDFGWRNGTGKYPAYSGDSFGSVVDVGFGSPTGIAFAYGTNFPEPYQSSLLIGDWSYGVIYKVELHPDGGTFTGELTPFVSAAPMAVTDMVVRPQDGCLYVAVGGRKTQSALYRVKYVGDKKGQPAVPAALTSEAKLRHELEESHRPNADAAAIELALKNLGNQDRAVRSAARIVLEHQEISKWKSAAMKITDPRAKITAGIAIARAGDQDDKSPLLAMLTGIKWSDLDDHEKLELLRAYQILFVRHGTPEHKERDLVIGQINTAYLSEHNSPLVNRELARVLLSIDAPGAVDRSVQLMQTSGSADDQIHYALCLRNVENGWTEANRKAYFQWFFDIASARGGDSFGGFIDNIRKAAIAKLDDGTKTNLGDLITKTPSRIDPAAALQARSFVKEWTVDDLVKTMENPRTANFENGKKLFAVAQCYQCHRFAGQGGIQGPDLTGAGGRFSPRDLLTAVVEPNKEISDQYQATQFLLDDDRIVVGRVANMNGESLSIATNMLDPEHFTNIKRGEIAETKVSPVSMMPGGLLNTFTADEIYDLVSFLRSTGNPNSAIYKK
jgi:putative heme-binding domain-containing protein